MDENDTTTTPGDEIKSGRRHSSADQAAINSIVDAAIFLGADHPRIAADVPAPGEWSPDEKSFVVFGDQIKALGENKIGGYLVRFGSTKNADLTGDYFTPGTDYGPHTETPIFYNHGLDPVLGKTVIGVGKMKRDDVGVWVEAQLAARAEYEQYVAAIYEMAAAGKMGWSSGTAGHLMDRKRTANGTNEITMWFLGLDASVTPTPAEPRTAAIPIKTFQDTTPMAEWPALNNAAVTEPESTNTKSIKQGTPKMGDEQTTAPVAMPAEFMKQFETLMTSVGLIAKDVETMKRAPVEPGAGIKAMTESGQAPAVHKSKNETLADEQLAALKSLAAREIGKDAWRAHNMKMATEQAALNRAWVDLVRDPVNPWKRAEYENQLKATMVTTAGSLGANLIPNRYSNNLVGTMMENSIMRAAGATIMTVEGTQSFNVPTITRSGSAPLTTETSANTQSEPTFGNVEFKPYAYRAEYRATREQLGDTRIPMEGVLMANAEWQLTQSENNHFGAGTGASQPQGINQATTAVSAGSLASLITYDHLVDLQHSIPYQYRSGAAWFMSDGIAKQVRKLRDGSGAAASLGRPLWEGSMTTGQPGNLLGNPVYTLNSMASSGSASNVIVYGHPGFFWIADFNNAGVDFQILTELYAGSAMVGWWFWKRVDSHIIVSEAFRGLRLV